jgi:hypothetical protein
MSTNRSPSVPRTFALIAQPSFSPPGFYVEELAVRDGSRRRT